MAKIIDVIMRLQDQVSGTLGRIRRQMEETGRIAGTNNEADN